MIRPLHATWAIALALALQWCTVAVSQMPQTFVPVYTEEEIEQITPTSPDPMISFLPSHVVPDHDYWKSKRYWNNLNNTQSNTPAPAPRATIIVDEQEPNNSQAFATPVPLGNESVPGKFENVIVNATFEPLTFVQTLVSEDNGSIPLATQTGVGVGEVTAALTRIGDGPHGSTGTQEGDFDYYATDFLPAGVFLEVDIDTFDGGLTLESFIILWNSNGEVVDFTFFDTRTFASDPYIGYRIETPGQYFVSISAFKSGTIYGTGLFTENFPENPDYSGSGGGHGSEGDYNITLRVTDIDVVSAELQAGDILGISSEGFDSAVLGLRLEKDDGSLLVSSSQNATFLYPNVHPYGFFNFANSHATYVIDEDGTYYISFLGSAPRDYQFDLKVREPQLVEDNASQTIYLTYSGIGFNYEGELVADLTTPININPSVWGGEDRDIQISPLLEFLNDLGFANDPDIAALNTMILIDIIESILVSNFPGVNFVQGPPPLAGIPANSSEIFVGGSMAETGLETIGISETIDPGNFKTNDTALVMLDEISFLLNFIPFTWIRSDDQDLDDLRRDIAYTRLATTFIANVVAHEAGHFLGNFHTDPINDVSNLMDAGGTSDLHLRMVGAGDDGVFNTVDDITVSFGLDEYDPTEGFGGVENTESVINIGVNRFGIADTNFDNLYVNFQTQSPGVGTIAAPFGETQEAVDVLNNGGTINIFAGSEGKLFEGANRLDKPMVIRNENPAGGVVRIGDK